MNLVVRLCADLQLEERQLLVRRGVAPRRPHREVDAVRAEQLDEDRAHASVLADHREDLRDELAGLDELGRGRDRAVREDRVLRARCLITLDYV